MPGRKWKKYVSDGVSTSACFFVRVPNFIFYHIFNTKKASANSIMHECVIVAIPLLKSQLYVPGLWILCHMLSNKIDVNLRAKKDVDS